MSAVMDWLSNHPAVMIVAGIIWVIALVTPVWFLNDLCMEELELLKTTAADIIGSEFRKYFRRKMYRIAKFPGPELDEAFIEFWKSTDWRADTVLMADGLESTLNYMKTEDWDKFFDWLLSAEEPKTEDKE